MSNDNSTYNRSKPQQPPAITDRWNHVDAKIQPIGDPNAAIHSNGTREIYSLDDPIFTHPTDKISVSLLGIVCRSTKSDIGNGLLVCQKTLYGHMKNIQLVLDGIRATASGRPLHQSDQQSIVSISACQRQTCARCIHLFSKAHYMYAACVGSITPGRGTSLVILPPPCLPVGCFAT